jgi:hypothetical protein
MPGLVFAAIGVIPGRREAANPESMTTVSD